MRWPTILLVNMNVRRVFFNWQTFPKASFKSNEIVLTIQSLIAIVLIAYVLCHRTMCFYEIGIAIDVFHGYYLVKLVQFFHGFFFVASYNNFFFVPILTTKIKTNSIVCVFIFSTIWTFADRLSHSMDWVATLIQPHVGQYWMERKIRNKSK